MPSHNGMELDQYLFDSVSITPEALSEEFARVSLDLAYWNAQYAEAYKQYRFAEIGHKRTKSMLYIKHRLLLQQAAEEEARNAPPEFDAKGKQKAVKVDRVTENQVEAAVSMDEDMVAADMLLVNTEVEKEKMRGVLDAVRAKREMVVSLGAQIRAEMAGDPLLRTQMANQRTMQSGNGG